MSAIRHVTDARSNLNDQLAYAAQIIGRSAHRLKVFAHIYFGRNLQKTATEISKAIKLPRKRVLEEGVKLVKAKIVGQDKKAGDVVYIKDDFYAHHKAKVIAIAKNPKKLKALPTKTSPRVIVPARNVSFPKAFFVKTKQVTVDDIDSFRKVRPIRPSQVGFVSIAECKFKNGIQKIIGEKGKFNDWGGERNDVYTTQLRIGGKRRAAAMAFKGPGKKAKKLTPGMMGKNGDQIQRLYSSSSADVYLVQYWKQIDESILDQMKSLAIARSAVERTTVYFGVIDETDSARVIRAYPQAFK